MEIRDWNSGLSTNLRAHLHIAERIAIVARRSSASRIATEAEAKYLCCYVILITQCIMHPTNSRPEFHRIQHPIALSISIPGRLCSLARAAGHRVARKTALACSRSTVAARLDKDENDEHVPRLVLDIRSVVEDEHKAGAFRYRK